MGQRSGKKHGITATKRLFRGGARFRTESDERLISVVQAAIGAGFLRMWLIHRDIKSSGVDLLTDGIDENRFVLSCADGHELSPLEISTQ